MLPVVEQISELRNEGEIGKRRDWIKFCDIEG